MKVASSIHDDRERYRSDTEDGEWDPNPIVSDED
jgi:hypothetical protein